MPRPDGTSEDDGWVMALVYDAEEQRTRLAILDARNLSGGCSSAGWEAAVPAAAAGSTARDAGCRGCSSCLLGAQQGRGRR